MYRFNSLIFGSRVFGCSVCRILCCLSRDSRLCIMQDCHWRTATCDMPPTGPSLLAFCGLWFESPTILTVITSSKFWLVTSCECHSPYFFRLLHQRYSAHGFAFVLDSASRQGSSGRGAHPPAPPSSKKPDDSFLRSPSQSTAMFN